MKIKNNMKDIPSPLITKVNGERLQQVAEYKYLGSTIYEYDEMRSIGDVKKCIGKRKTAFWNCKDLLK